MRNYYKKGSDAEIHAAGIEKGIEKVEAGAEEACDAIEYLEGELEERDETVSELETEIDELEKKLAATYASKEGLESLRVLRNIRLYVNDNIQILEKKFEQGKSTEEDGQS